MPVAAEAAARPPRPGPAQRRPPRPAGRRRAGSRPPRRSGPAGLRSSAQDRLPLHICGESVRGLMGLWAALCPAGESARRRAAGPRIRSFGYLCFTRASGRRPARARARTPSATARPARPAGTRRGRPSRPRDRPRAGARVAGAARRGAAARRRAPAAPGSCRACLLHGLLRESRGGPVIACPPAG
jgi:hypothetical protein